MLLDACRESWSVDLSDLVELALFTGLRPGEVLGLTWERVDRARWVMLLTVTKSHRRREVPLNSRADAVLARRGSKDSAGVRHAPGTTSVLPGNLRSSTPSWLHFRDLRHTFASWAVQRGATLLREIKDLLGHHSLAMALRYGHLAPEHLHSAVPPLDAALPVSDLAQASAQEVTNEVELLAKW